jgi:preprotein translocase subunit SecY
MAEGSTLLDLGIKVQDIVAGFAGGVVNAFVFKRSDPWSIVGSVIVGAFTANYLGEAASKYIGLGGGTSAFIVGLCGMAICQGLIEAVKKWRPGAQNDQQP